MKMDLGVLQGSALRPALWNILYGGVLNLNWQEGASEYAYPDDLAVMMEAKDEKDLVFKANKSLEQMAEWLKEKSLELALQKTEVGGLKKSCKKWDFCL